MASYDEYNTYDVITADDDYLWGKSASPGGPGIIINFAAPSLADGMV